MKVSATVKYCSGQGKPSLASPRSCYLRQTVPSTVFSCLKGSTGGKYHSWWEVTFRKAKEESQTEGRVPRQALVLYASGLGNQTA